MWSRRPGILSKNQIQPIIWGHALLIPRGKGIRKKGEYKQRENFGFGVYHYQGLKNLAASSGNRVKNVLGPLTESQRWRSGGMWDETANFVIGFTLGLFCSQDDHTFWLMHHRNRLFSLSLFNTHRHKTHIHMYALIHTQKHDNAYANLTYLITPSYL